MTSKDIVERVSSKLTWDEDFHRHYVSVYQVLLPYDYSPKQVASQPGLPTYGTSYAWYSDTDLWASCKSIEVEPGERIEGNKRKWTCTVKHSSKASEGSNDNDTDRENPLDEPPVVSGSFSPYRRVADVDKNGNAIQNSAGFPYDPPATVDGNYLVLRVSFNTAALSLSTWAAYGAEEGGVVNSDTIWGLAARRVKLRRWGFRVLYQDSGFSYVKNDMEFLISYKRHPTSPCVGPSGAVGWYTTLPNTGEGYFEDGTMTPEKYLLFKDREENPMSVGRLACDGDQSSSLKFNVFEVEPELPFASIAPNPLPGPFV